LDEPNQGFYFVNKGRKRISLDHRRLMRYALSSKSSSADMSPVLVQDYDEPLKEMQLKLKIDGQ
jgi:hypothetical protein